MNKSLINIKNLHKKYKYSNKYFSVLKNVNFKIYNSQIISIVGPSGVGKTTFLNILGLLDSYDSGKLLLYDLDKSTVISQIQTQNEAPLTTAIVKSGELIAVGTDRGSVRIVEIK